MGYKRGRLFGFLLYKRFGVVYECVSTWLSYGYIQHIYLWAKYDWYILYLCDNLYRNTKLWFSVYRWDKIEDMHPSLWWWNSWWCFLWCMDRCMYV